MTLFFNFEFITANLEILENLFEIGYAVLVMYTNFWKVLWHKVIGIYHNLEKLASLLLNSLLLKNFFTRHSCLHQYKSIKQNNILFVFKFLQRSRSFVRTQNNRYPRYSTENCKKRIYLNAFHPFNPEISLPNPEPKFNKGHA